mmetsp:Transcript_4729/g.12413  ORF Transcript_4729/g.12413 Transcript_4729/m.12413 type:complete len:94 (+) Transcript_4729:113-394(+)
MNFAGSNSSYPSNAGNNAPSESQMMHQVKAELATAYAQEFYNTVRDKCFAACVTKPGSSLSSSETTCLGRCCERYIDATKVVSESTVRSLGNN